MINNVKTGTYIRMTENGEENYNFNFYTNLSASDKLDFVNSVVSTLIDENGYSSIIRNLVFDFTLIKMLADIDVSLIYTDVDDDGEPINPINDIENFLLETNIMEIIKANVSPTLLDELNKAIDNNIQYLTGIRFNPLADALASLVFVLEKKVNEVDLNSMMDIAQKFVASIGEPTLENIVNAYINSDAHKNNLEEIAEAKKIKTEFAEDINKAINETKDVKKPKKINKKSEN